MSEDTTKTIIALFAPLTAMALVAAARPVTAETSRTVKVGVRGNIEATLYTPDGPGPFASVIVIHTSQGLVEADRQYCAALAREGFADRHYEDDGNLSPRSIPGTVYKDPDKALAQCLSMVKDRCLTSRLGKKVTVEVETICLHGDEPTAVNVARHVRKGLEAAGGRIATIPEMVN
mgnify:CR=1 FL=1